MYKVIIIVLIVTVVGIVTFAAVENMSGAIVAGTTSSLVDSNMLTCTVSGEVTRPGTYLMDIGTTLGDLLSKASGATSNADPLAYYPTYELADGMSFYIAPIYDNGDTCAVTPISKVNINTADKATLMQVPGFGDAVASSLITYRSETSLFYRLEEIKNVVGIGEATFTKAKDHITLKAA